MRQVLLSLTTLLLTTIPAQAQGIMGTSQSFSTSAYCKSYTCTLLKRDGQHWTYKNKYGDIITLKRATTDPGSRVVSALVGIPEADSDYFTHDRDMLSALQRTLYGKVIAAFPWHCYETEEAHVFAEFKHGGVLKRFGCLPTPQGGLIVALGGDQPIR